jgi:hypothetical protein
MFGKSLYNQLFGKEFNIKECQGCISTRKEHDWTLKNVPDLPCPCHREIEWWYSPVLAPFQNINFAANTVVPRAKF